MRLVVAVVVLSLLSVTVGSQLVTANSVADASCIPNRSAISTQHHDGWYKHPGGTVYTVRSLLDSYNGYVYPNDPNAVATVWVMLTNTFHNNWAQTGWIEEHTGVRSTFYQYTDGGEVISLIGYYSPPADNSWTQYRSDYYSDQYVAYVTFKHESTTLAQVGVDWIPTEAQVAGETINLKTQMPGAISNHAQMPAAFYNDASGQHYFNGSYGDWDYPEDADYFGRNIVSIWQLDIWDKGCNS